MDVLFGPSLKFMLTYIVISSASVTAKSHCSAMTNSIGYTEPSGDIVLEKGERLNITCIINSDDPEYSDASDRLYFCRNEERIPNHMIDVVNSSTIVLSIEPPLGKDDNYICYFNDSKSTTPKIVCLNVVTVGVKPQPVNDFSCIGRNYDNFSCSWTPPQNYVKTEYNLFNTFKQRANRAFRYTCPKMIEEDGKIHCFWNLSTKPQYRQAQETFYFSLNSNNTFGNHVDNYIINQFKFVIPNKPEQLTVVQKTAHSVALNWTIPSSIVNFPKGLGHRIWYKSEFDQTAWHKKEILNTTGEERGVPFNLTDLSYAHALYDIRVSMISAVANRSNESMWSDFTSVTVRTESEIPDCPPRTTSGCFEIESTKRDSREVYVYWQKIMDYQQNGEHFEYKVEVLGCSNVQHEIGEPKTYVKFSNLPKKDCKINIWSENEMGRSLENTTIVVPEIRLDGPRNFVKLEQGGDTYKLSWDPPASQIHVTNYTIFWCNSKRDRPYKCNGYLNWTTVHRGTKRFSKTFSKPSNQYQFAISANTPRGSSEMIWATCTMLQRGTPGQMTNFWFNNYGSNFVELNWKIDCNDGIDVVKGFIIYYCPVSSLVEDVCNEEERNVTIVGDKNTPFGNVTGLKPHTMYKFAVAAKINDTHYSLKSEYKYNTTSEAAPSTPPQNVILYNITESSISIKWEEPKTKNGAIQYYRIYYNNHSVEVGSLNILKTNHTLTDLTSYENYSIKMQACTKDCSENSTIQTVTTKIGTPVQIKKPYVTNIQNGTLKIEWNRPTPPKGPVNYYELKFMEKYGDQYKTTDTVNVTGGHSYNYKPDNCGNYGSSFIAVRAININKYGEHKRGPWSAALEAQCNTYSTWIYIPIILLFLVLSMAFVYYAVKKCYNKYTTMKNIEVKLPPGLDPVVPWGSEKHNEDVDHQSRADEALLLDKMPEVRSGESSGCSSGNESLTCSESPTQTANSDSGTEQPSSLTDENIRFRKNISGKGGYVLPDAIQWGSTKPAPNPASNYCVLGVDPSSNQNQSAAPYHPSPESPTNISMPYLSSSATTTLPSSYTSSEFVKTQNPNYVPFIPNDPARSDKSSGYVVAGVTKDLMGDEMMLSKEDGPIYLKGSEFAPNIQFPWQMQDSNFSKAGYVSVGEAPPPPKVNKGYVPHRQFDAKSVKGD